MSLKGHRTLVFDNSPLTRDRIVSKLAANGLEKRHLFIATSALDFEKYLKKHQINLIFIDHSFITVDVFKMLDLIESMTLSEVPTVVVMAAYPTRDFLQTLAQRKVWIFLPKPFLQSKLSEVLTRYLLELSSTYKELIKKAHALFLARDFEGALELANKAIEIESRPIDAYFLIAQIEEQLEHFDLAIENHEKCLTIDESFFGSLQSLFLLYFKAEEYSKAYETGLILVHNFKVESRIACQVIRLLFITNSYDDIMPLYLRFTSLEEMDPVLANHLGSGLYVVGKNFMIRGVENYGFSCFDALVESFDSFPKFLMAIAFYFISSGRLEEAEIYIDFINTEEDRRVCESALYLGTIDNNEDFVFAAKNEMESCSHLYLRSYVLSKFQDIGISEEEAIRQLDN